MSKVYKIQINDGEPIEVSQQVYEVSFCFNEMLKEKEKEIQDLKQKNDYLNDLEASAVEYKELQNQLQQKENMIKEVREKIKEVREKIKELCWDYEYETYSNMTSDEVKELAELLDKEVN